MDYRILGDTLPVVEIRLMTGEAMYTQSGGMAWMSEGLTLDSNIKGGLMKDRKSTRLNSSHEIPSRMPSSA